MVIFGSQFDHNNKKTNINSQKNPVDTNLFLRLQIMHWLLQCLYFCF